MSYWDDVVDEVMRLIDVDGVPPGLAICRVADQTGETVESIGREMARRSAKKRAGYKYIRCSNPCLTAAEHVDHIFAENGIEPYRPKIAETK